MLAASLEAVRSCSRGQVALVAGEAGVGKTALLQRFRDELSGSVRVVWGTCDPLFTPRPLGPPLSMFEEVGGELAEVARGEARPHEIAAALVHALEGRPATVFVLEDVHWADEATLDVVRLLARRSRRRFPFCWLSATGTTSWLVTIHFAC